MSYFYHACDLKDLRAIKSSGFLRAPVFVYTGNATPYNPARDCVLTLDLRGFNNRRDPHPLGEEGYRIIDRNISASRIRKVECFWGTKETAEKEGLLTDA